MSAILGHSNSIHMRNWITSPLVGAKDSMTIKMVPTMVYNIMDGFGADTARWWFTSVCLTRTRSVPMAELIINAHAVVRANCISSSYIQVTNPQIHSLIGYQYDGEPCINHVARDWSVPAGFYRAYAADMVQLARIPTESFINMEPAAFPYARHRLEVDEFHASHRTRNDVNNIRYGSVTGSYNPGNPRGGLSTPRPRIRPDLSAAPPVPAAPRAPTAPRPRVSFGPTAVATFTPEYSPRAPEPQHYRPGWGDVLDGEHMFDGRPLNRDLARWNARRASQAHQSTPRSSSQPRRGRPRSLSQGEQSKTATKAKKRSASTETGAASASKSSRTSTDQEAGPSGAQLRPRSRPGPGDRNLSEHHLARRADPNASTISSDDSWEKALWRYNAEWEQRQADLDNPNISEEKYETGSEPSERFETRSEASISNNTDSSCEVLPTPARPPIPCITLSSDSSITSSAKADSTVSVSSGENNMSVFIFPDPVPAIAPVADDEVDPSLIPEPVAEINNSGSTAPASDHASFGGSTSGPGSSSDSGINNSAPVSTSNSFPDQDYSQPGPSGLNTSPVLAGNATLVDGLRLVTDFPGQDSSLPGPSGSNTAQPVATAMVIGTDADGNEFLYNATCIPISAVSPNTAALLSGNTEQVNTTSQDLNDVSLVVERELALMAKQESETEMIQARRAMHDTSSATIMNEAAIINEGDQLEGLEDSEAESEPGKEEDRKGRKAGN